MAESVPEPMAIPQVAAPDRFSKAKVIIIKIIVLTALTLALGFAQGWASSRCYKPDHVAGFHMGLLHGMLMPAALPGLLMGQDLPIYAPNNSGRRLQHRLHFRHQHLRHACFSASPSGSRAEDAEHLRFTIYDLRARLNGEWTRKSKS